MLFNELPDLLNQSIKSSPFFIHNRSAANERHESSISVFYANSSGAFTTFNDYLDLTVVLFLRLEYPSKGSHSVDLVGSGLVNGCVVLSGQEYCAVGGQCLFECAH